MSERLDLHKSLLKKKAAVLGTEKPEYKTNGEFRPSVFSQRGAINIKVTTDESALKEVYKFFKFDEEASKELGFDAKHLGYTVEEWLHDVKLRANVLKRNETLREIEQLEAELFSDVLTAKERREIKTDGIKDRIKDL